MTVETQMKIARNLKTLRMMAKETQKEVAKKLAVCTNVYARYEQGETLPDLCTLGAAANLYQTPLDLLVKVDIAGLMCDYILHQEYTKQNARFMTIHAKLSYAGKEQLLAMAKDLSQKEEKMRIEAFRISV